MLIMFIPVPRLKNIVNENGAIAYCVNPCGFHLIFIDPMSAALFGQLEN